MGLSSLKGNGGYLGIDKRGESGSTGTTGNVSIKKHFLERISGNFAPIIPLPIDTLFIDDFEDGTLDKWTVVNGGETSYWVVGTTQNTTYPLSSGGTYSCYISTNGTNYEYTTNGDSHIYFDVSVPAEAVTMTLDFDWMCNGESTYDYGYVRFTTTSVTPIAGTLYTTNRIGGGTSGRFDDVYNALADTQYVHETITLNSGTTDWGVGVVRRFVFSWRSDSSIQNQPPFGIDNVILKYST